MTIVESIQSVLRGSSSPMTIEQIYQKIIDFGLYQFNAKDPKSIVRQQVRRHCAGLSFPSANPNKYFMRDEGGKYHLLNKYDYGLISSLPKDDKEKIPEEHIQDFHRRHLLEVERALIDKMLNVEAVFFEQLVLDLLLKMGYGSHGSISPRKKGADGGIDGEILQDKLGFDRIYTQAKRYSLKKSVQVSEVRDFVGALKNISKGVFITTSRFTKQAKEYALEQQQKSLVLIDGEQLAKLMIEFGLGVQNTFSYSTYRIDPDYFGGVDG